ncbi:MAG: TIR domain-containing protein [Alistipes sp.]|nr:TIR domain-containing protein [Alistipes sp.]
MKYDVFISCKSEDYKFARQIYNFLTGPELNYKVFLADAELRKKGKTFYGKVIDAALEASDHLILFASKVEYVTTEYVENEWRLFLEEQRSGNKKGNIVTILKGVDTKSLPISLRHIQSIPFDEYKSVIDFLPKFEEGDEALGHRESDDESAELTPPTPPTPSTPSLKKWLWMVAALLLIVGGIFGGRAIKSRVDELQFVRDSLKQAQLYQDSLEYVQAERAAFVKDSTDKANAAARKAEANRLAKEKAEKEEAEQERLAAEKAERERLAAEQAAQEKAEKERREREAREEAEKAERERLAREAANKTYKVGDYYNVNGKEGVVFYVDETGKHGKIVSMTQSSEILQWSSNKNEQKQLIGASSKTNGAANMQAVQQRPNWRTDYPAFAWCARLGSGWYLPAIEELKLFTLNDSVHDAVNRTLAAKGGTKLPNKGDLGKYYWSSTEYDYQYSDGAFCAWLVDMRSGNTGYYDRSFDNYVRAVSAF